MKPARSILFLALGLAACGGADPTAPTPADGAQLARVPVLAGPAPGISTLVIEVTATDIETPLIFNVTIDNDATGDTISIPAGSNRTITVRGFDASSIETHRGAVTTSLAEGDNPAVTVTLDPLTGEQPVIVVLGGIRILVDPPFASIDVGSTAQFTALVVNEADDTLDVQPLWASLNPAVAEVDSTGLVTAISVGSAQIVATYAGVGAAAEVTAPVMSFPTTGLIAWYPFSGNTMDESGNGLHAGATGVALTTDRDGNANSALLFDGTSSEVVVPHSSLLDVEAITVSAWVLRDPADTYCPGLVNKLTAGNLGWSLGVCRNPAGTQASDSLAWSGASASGQYWGQYDAPAPAFNEWHHVAGTHSDGTVQFYVDGVLVGEDSTSLVLLPTTEPLRIGYRVGFGQGLSVPEYYWAGKVDDVGVWDRALSPSEIAYLAGN